jgi:heme/copper-type cytochrome/quinol oxidase subunit 2
LADHEAVVAHKHARRLDSPTVSRTQRLSFLGIAVVIAIVAAVVLSTTGSDESGTSAESTPAATATAGADETATPTATATPRPEPPLVTGKGVTKLRFKQGETVRFRVKADTADEVHVHGYDLKKDVEAGKTVTFSFPASITGIFEIEFENAARQIAQLRVDP